MAESNAKITLYRDAPMPRFSWVKKAGGLIRPPMSCGHKSPSPNEALPVPGDEKTGDRSSSRNFSWFASRTSGRGAAVVAPNGLILIVLFPGGSGPFRGAYFFSFARRRLCWAHPHNQKFLPRQVRRNGLGSGLGKIAAFPFLGSRRRPDDDDVPLWASSTNGHGPRLSTAKVSTSRLCRRP